MFHPGATENHGPWFSGPATEYVDRVLELAGGRWGLSCVHLIASCTTEIVGDEAWSEAPFCSVSRVKATGVLYDYTFCARFLARCERLHGEWRYCERALVEDLSRVDPVASHEVAGTGAFPPAQRGSRSAADPSYRFFAAASAARRVDGGG